MSLFPLGRHSALPRCRPLRPGGTIGIFSSSAPLERSLFERGVKTIESLGYRTRIAADPSAYFDDRPRPITSHPLAERLDSFESLLSDPEVDVLIAARGGYGSHELLPLLSLERIRASGKLIVGYSDLSSFLASITQWGRVYTVHGPTVGREFALATECADSQASVEALLKLLTDPTFRLSTEGKVLRGGRSEGRILAGNLTMLTTLLGTPWDVDYNGAVLCIEEIAEAPYRVHRLLLQLKQAGKLDNLGALLLGRFSNCELPGGVSVEEVIRSFVAEHLNHTHYPVLTDLPFGHHGKNLPLPNGCRAEVRETTVKVLESPIA